jgi:hypothetical protein
VRLKELARANFAAGLWAVKYVRKQTVIGLSNLFIYKQDYPVFARDMVAFSVNIVTYSS